MKAWRVFIAALLFCAVLGLPGSALADLGSSYTVQTGDTLAIIAARFGTSASAIARANALSNANKIFAGQRLMIPGRSPTGTGSASAGQSSAGASAGTRYTIRSGDTLGDIAARFGVSAAAIARANGLSNPDRLRVGMQLLIPGASSGKSSGGSSSTGMPPAGSSKGLRFVASISQQTCWLYSGGTVQHRWRCSTGRRGAGTLPGTFKVRSKLPRAYGATWNFWMPYWLGIYMAGSLENGIHGLPSNASTGKKVWQNAIGTPVTFGCIMLDDAAARTLYNVAYIGMPVIIVR